MREEAQLLRTQLAEAREDPDASPLELAALAGLILRLELVDPALEALRVSLSPGPDLDEAADAALDRILDVDEGDDPAESWDALCGLDELCAAATFLGRGVELSATVADACGMMRAFPEIWRLHADIATVILTSRAPLDGDPARALWRAVEASRWDDGVTPDEDEEGASPELRRALGLDVVISLAAFRARQPVRLAAADALPEPPPWQDLGRGAGWELAITVSEGGEPVLLCSASEAVFLRDGQIVETRHTHEGRTCLAASGAWELQVGEELHSFWLEP